MSSDIYKNKHIRKLYEENNSFGSSENPAFQPAACLGMLAAGYKGVIAVRKAKIRSKQKLHGN